MVERVLCMHKVRGSIPCVSIFCFLRLCAHSVTRRQDHLFLFRAPRPSPSVRTAQGPTRSSRWRPVRSRSTRTSRTSRWTSCARDPTVRARLPFPSPDAIAPAPLPDVRLTSLAPTPRVAVFELAKMRPAYGVGSRFARSRWEERGARDSFWTVTRMKPRPSGRSGSAWGFLTWKGKARPGVTRIPKAQTPGIWKVLEEETETRGPALAMPPKEETQTEGQDE